MSALLVVSPVYEIHCDSCPAKHRPERHYRQVSENSARGSALDAGWQTRPFRGKGSRTAPDLCPDCKPAGESR